jgi:hypothetical protein
MKMINDYDISVELGSMDKQALMRAHEIMKAVCEQLDKTKSPKLYSLDTPYQQYSKKELMTACEFIEELIDGSRFQTELVEWR